MVKTPFPWTSKDLLHILPHRYPFLLIDRVEKIIKGEKSPVGDKIVGYKYVSYNEFFFQGHFPNHPVMPGVLVIEALAQVGVILAFSYQENEGDRYFPYFTGIDEAKFRKPVFPGSLLRLEFETIKVTMKKFLFGKGQVFLEDQNNELVCEAKLSSAIVPKKDV